MIKKIKSILNKKFVKNVLVLVTGTAAAQAVTMALSPIITRLYGPEAFGIMGTFNALISILVPIAAFTYPVAIVLPKKDEEAKGIMKLSLLSATLFSSFILILVILFKRDIATLLNMESISNYFYLLPLVIISAAFMQIIEQWLIRNNQFSINAKATFIQSSFVNISKVGIGFYYPFAQVLIFFSSITNGIRGLLMYVFTKKKDKSMDIRSIIYSNYNLKKIASIYKDFPLYRAPQDLLFSLQQSFPIVLLTVFFGPAATGFYTISRSVLSLPTNLIGKAVGDVVYPRLSKAANMKEDISKLLKKSTIMLVLVGLIPYGIVILFGPFLFGFVFGSSWYAAGEYARWVALWSFSTLINRPSVRALPVLEAQRFHLIYTIILAMINLVMIIVGYLVFNSDLISVALFCLSGTIANVFLITITIKFSKKRN